MSDLYRVGKAKEDEPSIRQPKHAGVVPKVHFRWLLSGPSKSGKSNLARWALDKYYADDHNPRKSWFDEIWLLSPTANIDYLWADLAGLEPDHRIDRPSAALLVHILSKQVKAMTGGSMSQLKKFSPAELLRLKKKAPNVLIIFDDAIAESALMTSSAFMKIFIQGRHYNISSMTMTQSYVRVPRSVRLQATHLSFFPSRVSEIERVYNEYGPVAMNRKEFIEMVKFATTPAHDDPYPFLFVDAFAPESTRFRRNFGQVLEINGDGHIDEAAEQEEKEEHIGEAPPVMNSKRKRNPSL